MLINCTAKSAAPEVIAPVTLALVSVEELVGLLGRVSYRILSWGWGTGW